MDWSAQLRRIGEKAAAGNEAARRYLAALAGDIGGWDPDMWLSDFLGGRPVKKPREEESVRSAIRSVTDLASGQRPWADEPRPALAPSSVVCWFNDRPLDAIAKRARAIVARNEVVRKERKPPRCHHCGQPLPKHMRKH